MSFTIYWEKFDKRVAQSVQAQLNSFFRNLDQRPEFLGEIAVDALDFGSVPPYLEIMDLTEPYPEFYLATEEDATTNNNTGGGHTVPPTPAAMAAGDTAAGRGRQVGEQDVFTVDDDLESALSRVPDRPASQATVRSYFGNPMDALLAGSGTQTPVPRIWTTAMGAARMQRFRGRAETPSEISRVLPGEVVVERSADDMQLLAKVEYSGDMSVVLRTELQLNYPATQFASLPVTLHITKIEFSAVAVVAYLKNRVNFCFLEPDVPRQSLLDSFSIRTEIGDAHHHVLKNVEKLELFITEQLRKVIDDEFVFPAYHSFEL
ncbi:Mitochondrial distribution and morphology protein 12 [Coemansia sp. RSA 2599]|nr:Mitochondrial distribution and morphology protein 12 [Coemansia sp. RSA 2598]KAJ1828651.1 Mitochondrial distribution and morphology protein 12 [Coemansia sp. RSA 2599]